MVALILILPALATKIVIPHVLPEIPWAQRPIRLALLWAVAGIFAAVAPPDVRPVLRILCAAVASATAAAAEVSSLGHLRHFGRPGLAGWGMGTGAAASAWAVAPYVLTANMRMALRDCLWYVTHLVAAMLFAHYIFLRHPPVSKIQSDDHDNHDSHDMIKFDAVAAGPGSVFSVREPIFRASTATGRIRHNLKVTDKLVRPYMRPLLCSFTLQMLVAPGMARAYAKLPAFATFESFFAAYSLAFHAGSFVSRSAILLHRAQKLRRVPSAMTVVAALIVVNGIFAFVATPVVVLPAMFVAGLLGGAVYAHVFATAVEQTSNEHVDDAEYTLGVIGVGETAGVLLGTLLGTFIEMGFCEVDRGTGLRWCYSEHAL